MGSFLVSCSVTKQVIREDEKCYLMPLHLGIEKRLDDGNFSIARSAYNSGDIWKPMDILIPVLYNDYGNFILDRDELSSELLNDFLQFLSSNATKNTASDDRHPFDISGIIPLQVCSPNEADDILKSLVRATWYMGINIQQQYPQYEVPLAFMVVKKTAVDYWCDKYDKYTTFDNNNTIWIEHYKQKLDFLRNKANDGDRLLSYVFAILVRDIVTELFDTPNFGKLVYPDHFYFEYVGDAINNDPKHRAECERISLDGTASELFDLILSIINERVPKHILNNSKKLIAFNIGMVQCNLPYLPAITSGQDYSNETGNAFFDLVKHVNTIDTKVISEYYDE